MSTDRFSRRVLLRFIAGGAIVGLAGCSAVTGGHDPVPIPDASPGPDDWPTSGYDATAVVDRRDGDVVAERLLALA